MEIVLNTIIFVNKKRTYSLYVAIFAISVYTLPYQYVALDHNALITN